MPGCWVHRVLCLFLICILAVAVMSTAQHFELLDQTRLSGPIILGLAFFAIAIFGIYMQLGADLDDALARDIIRQFLIYLIQSAIFMPAFAGGIWLILVALGLLLSPFLPEGIVQFLFIVAFLFYVIGVIKLLVWLSDRGSLAGAVLWAAGQRANCEVSDEYSRGTPQASERRSPAPG